MPSDPDHQGIDWDGLFTFFLTLLVVGFGAGLPLLITYLYALRISQASVCGAKKDSSLLVFGKRLVNDSVDLDYRVRLDKAQELIVQNPQRRVILLGGSPQDERLSEAMAGLNYLETKGVENHDSIQLEEGSRNTLENLRHAREMLQSKNHHPVILITNRYHLARSRMIASSLGIENVLSPAESRFFFGFSVMGKLLFEAFYILWFTTGKSWARMTRNERMLNRVT
ncbi:MAG: YdcF family protein [Pseudomonadota bacterium]